MLELAFQNPSMMFFTSFDDKECNLCSKKTKSFFLAGINCPLCLDCFDVFFVRHSAVREAEKEINGGKNESF